MPDGKGAVGAGHYPALAGDASAESSQFMALTLLGGRRNMPAFGGTRRRGHVLLASPTLNDEQIAAVINYVRTHFGNHFTATRSPRREVEGAATRPLSDNGPRTTQDSPHASKPASRNPP